MWGSDAETWGSAVDMTQMFSDWLHAGVALGVTDGHAAWKAFVESVARTMEQNERAGLWLLGIVGAGFIVWLDVRLVRWLVSRNAGRDHGSPGG